MEFNFKGVKKSGWISLGVVIAIMIGALIFKPEFTETQIYVISGAIGLFIVYQLLNVTGILGKLFNKKK